MKEQLHLLCVRPEPVEGFRFRSLFLQIALALAAFAPMAHADWKRDDTTIAWQADGHTLWKFSFDPQRGKPFFDPLSAGANTSLTNFRPEDHPWHYGLWFSWKYINGVNYWEEDRLSGKAEGATRWSTPKIDAHSDGSATIQLDVTYTHPSGRVDMTETRELKISTPRADGGYTIDWSSHFTAGKAGAVLDRTPMPGEPEGKVNGGYGGLSARLAASPIIMSVVTPDGPVTQFASDRARPASSAVAANFKDGGRDVGAIAILSDPANIAGRAPWYVINSEKAMRFLCAAVLAPQVRTLAANGEWHLNYRIEIQRAPFTPETLRAAVAKWKPAAIMQSAAFEWNDIPAKQDADGIRTLRQFFQAPTATLDELELHVTTLAAGESSHAPHRHPNEELVIIKEGTVEVLVNDQKKRVGPGSVIFNASNQWHSLTNVGTGPATYHVINWRSPATMPGE